MHFAFVSVVYLALILFSVTVGNVQAQAQEVKQPINFNHRTHVNDNMIPCEFCHVYAYRSEVAGLPPVQSCIGCHGVIKGSTPEQQTDIEAIFIKYRNNNIPIPWKKIHDLPDFVYFSHKRHLRAGFGCFECHGHVNMVATPLLFEKFGQTPLSMGWCLQCHKMKHQIVKAESDASRLTGDAPLETRNSLLQITITGSTDCLACHK